MNAQFITRLSRGAEHKAFRVLAEDGGFQDVIDELLSRPYGELLITTQRDSTQVFLKVFVNHPEQVSQYRTSYRFDGFYGEILDVDGHSTGNFVKVTLSIDTAVSNSGGTAGVLRMERTRHLPNTA